MLGKFKIGKFFNLEKNSNNKQPITYFTPDQLIEMKIIDDHNYKIAESQPNERNIITYIKKMRKLTREESKECSFIYAINTERWFRKLHELNKEYLQSNLDSDIANKIQEHEKSRIQPTPITPIFIGEDRAINLPRNLFLLEGKNYHLGNIHSHPYIEDNSLGHLFSDNDFINTTIQPIIQRILVSIGKNIEEDIIRIFDWKINPKYDINELFEKITHLRSINLPNELMNEISDLNNKYTQVFLLDNYLQFLNSFS